MPTDANPYAAPATVPGVAEPSTAHDLTEAERIRQAHLKHEASIKSISLLYFLAAGLASLVCQGGLYETLMNPPQVKGMFGYELFLAGLVGAMAGLLFAVAMGLRRLRPWVRTPVAGLAAIGLLGVPMGTIVSAYILYLVMGKKGSLILSEPYQAILAQTPHIKYRASILPLFLLVLVIVLVFALLLWSISP